MLILLRIALPELPVTDPVLQFTIILFLVLLAPMLLQRLRIPGIVGLILAGMIFGPFGLGILARNDAIKLFGTVGLLYIMFIAGAEINLRDFRQNRNQSLVHGFTIFGVSIVLGYVLFSQFFGFGRAASLLLADFCATYTLISYPIVSRLGLTQQRAVTSAVGGSIIADTAALLALTAITGAAHGKSGYEFWATLGVSAVIFLVMVWFGFGNIARWFFKRIESEGVSQYIFTMAIVFASAFLAQLAGLEAIIGAFMAGLTLNRLIPSQSALMNRLHFMGNALFIPFFLLSVGMLIDVSVFFKNPRILLISGALLFVHFVAKAIASWLTASIYDYSKYERNLLFGMSSAKTAAALAIALLGVEVGLFSTEILNGAVICIFITSLVSTFITEFNGRKIALELSQKPVNEVEETERILVPLANPANFEQLLDLAILVKDPKSSSPIYPISVVSDNIDTKQNILQNKRIFERAAAHAAATETELQVVTRVFHNVAGGINGAIKDYLITDVIMGWSGNASAIDKFFGGIIQQLLPQSDEMILVSKLAQPVQTIQRIIVAVPPHAERELGFAKWLITLYRLSTQLAAPICVLTPSNRVQKLWRAMLDLHPKMNISFLESNWHESTTTLKNYLLDDDLLIVITSRPHGVSYYKPLDRIPNQLSELPDKANFIILYPKQYALNKNEAPTNN